MDFGCEEEEEAGIYKADGFVVKGAVSEAADFFF